MKNVKKGRKQDVRSIYGRFWYVLIIISLFATIPSENGLIPGGRCRYNGTVRIDKMVAGSHTKRRRR